jgi:hypothetical protein
LAGCLWIRCKITLYHEETKELIGISECSDL